MYCDYIKMFPWKKHIPRISHLVRPYTLYCTLQEPQDVTAREEPVNAFLDYPVSTWLADDAIQKDFGRRFANYGTPTGKVQTEPLRKLQRMVEVTEQDAMHFGQTSPVAEVISAHNVVNKRDDPLGVLPGLPSLDRHLHRCALVRRHLHRCTLALHV
jgi:hypothetical protein